MNKYAKGGLIFKEFSSNCECGPKVFWHLTLLRNGKPRRDPKTWQNLVGAREEARRLVNIACSQSSVLRSSFSTRMTVLGVSFSGTWGALSLLGPELGWLLALLQSPALLTISGSWCVYLWRKDEPVCRKCHTEVGCAAKWLQHMLLPGLCDACGNCCLYNF